MEEQLCHCGWDSPRWKGKGVVSNPLEYKSEESRSYHCPMGMLSSRSSFCQNASPIPIPIPELSARLTTVSIPGPSDKENIVPKAIKPTLVLMELIPVVEETESD